MPHDEIDPNAILCPHCKSYHAAEAYVTSEGVPLIECGRCGRQWLASPPKKIPATT